MKAKGKREAPKARNMKARGKREAKRSASPLDCDKFEEVRPERPEYPTGITPFQGYTEFLMMKPRGDALRFALRLPLAFISRAFGALHRLFVHIPLRRSASLFVQSWNVGFTRRHSC